MKEVKIRLHISEANKHKIEYFTKHIEESCGSVYSLMVNSPFGYIDYIVKSKPKKKYPYIEIIKK